MPLRVVFEQGAKVAAQERTYSEEQLRTLPTTSSVSFDSDEPTVLPNPAWIETPEWLLDTLRRSSANGNLRAWTRELVNRFGVKGDRVIADTFMDMPFMNHHVYVTAMLQLAFLPDDKDPSDLLDVVRYPRGPDKGRLWASLWERMIGEIEKTCDYFMMETDVSKQAVDNLRMYTCEFRKGDVKLVGGPTTPHILRRVILAEFDVTGMQSSKHVKSKRGLKSCKSSSSIGTDTVPSTVEASETSESTQPMKPSKNKANKKGIWRRFYGWVKA